MKDFKFKINGKDYATSVVEQENGTLQVTVNGTAYEVEMPEAAAPKAVSSPAVVAAPAAAPVAGGSQTVQAPLPGTITQVVVSAGQKVKKGDVLVVMEAMKMANDITAECDGTVASVSCSVGQSVNQGDALVVINAEGAPAAAPAPKAAPAPAPAAKPAAGASVISSPLPGTITSINVKVGQAVKAGDTVLVLEAMKMANDITAECDGTVKAILVQQGAQVQSDEALIELA